MTQADHDEIIITLAMLLDGLATLLAMSADEKVCALAKPISHISAIFKERHKESFTPAMHAACGGLKNSKQPEKKK